jgi:hypothetical protein
MQAGLDTARAEARQGRANAEKKLCVNLPADESPRRDSMVAATMMTMTRIMVPLAQGHHRGNVCGILSVAKIASSVLEPGLMHGRHGVVIAFAFGSFGNNRLRFCES